jgi:hypothetical protein
MIGGVIMVLTTIWVYQTLLRVKKPNVLLWAAGCAALFLTMQFLFYTIDVEIIDALDGKDPSDTYERDLTSVGDRKTQEGIGGAVLPTFLELLPPLAGFLSVAVVRTLFITKEALTPANLFSGLKELFGSIKNSFKTSGN